MIKWRAIKCEGCYYYETFFHGPCAPKCTFHGHLILTNGFCAMCLKNPEANCHVYDLTTRRTITKSGARFKLYKTMQPWIMFKKAQ